MVDTRATAAENLRAFKDVVIRLCEYDENHDGFVALFGVLRLTSASDFLDLERDDIKGDTLHVYEMNDQGVADTNRPVRIQRHVGNKLAHLRQFLMEGLQARGDARLTPAVLDTLNVDEFDIFRISNSNVIMPTVPAPPVRPSSNTGTNNSHSSQLAEEERELADFKRGIKRDMAVFPTLVNDSSFDSYWRALNATAKAQGLGNVLDQHFNPGTSVAQQSLFQGQQEFMYAVLNTTIKTSIGQTFVRAHCKDSDAQKIIGKLLAHYTKSTSANFTKLELLHQLTGGLKLNENWRSSNENFILHWQERMRQYEEISTTIEHIADPLKKQLLRVAVRDSESLRQVQILEEQNTANGQTPITFDQYVVLLLSAAANHDKSTGQPIRRSQLVNNHQLDILGGHFSADGEENDEVNNGNDQHYTVNRTYIPPHLWKHVDAVPELKDFLLKDNFSPSPVRGTPENQHDAKGKVRINTHESTTSGSPCAEADMTETQGQSACEDDGFYDTTQGEDDANPYLTFFTKQKQNVIGKKISSKDVRSVMSPPKDRRGAGIPPRFSEQTEKGYEIEINGHRFLQINTMRYKVSLNEQSKQGGALVDRGANGCMAGADVRVIATAKDRKVDVGGIGNAELNGLPIVTVAGHVKTDKGPVVLIMHQCAGYGKGKTILSSIQLEHYGITVDDRPRALGGDQRIVCPDGYNIPLSVRNGLPYMDLRPPTDKEYQELPHVFLTMDGDWDPQVVDMEINHDEFFDCRDELEDPTAAIEHGQLFGATGNYNARVNQVVQQTSKLANGEYYNGWDIEPDPHYFSSDDYDWNGTSSIPSFTVSYTSFTEYNRSDYKVFDMEQRARTVKQQEPDYNLYRPCLLWASANVIKRTFEATTQYARNSYRIPFQKHHNACNPALNIARRNEAVAADIVYADVPAVDDGSTAAVAFFGRSSYVGDTEGIKSDSQFINA